jgi:CrcB protein
VNRPHPALAIFAGGMLGALARTAVGEVLPAAPGSWPWATLAVNVLGSALLGWAFTRLPAGAWERPLLTTGFCGALTTFSTFQLELLQMLDDGRVAMAATYAAISVAAGLIAVRVAER